MLMKRILALLMSVSAWYDRGSLNLQAAVVPQAAIESSPSSVISRYTLVSVQNPTCTDP
jgi:hypothetical protein